MVILQKLSLLSVSVLVPRLASSQDALKGLAKGQWVRFRLRVRRGWKHRALRPQKPLGFIRDGEVEGSEILYLTATRYTSSSE